MCVLLFTEWRVTITYLTDIIFFHFCKINGDSLSTCIHLHMTINIPPEKS